MKIINTRWKSVPLGDLLPREGIKVLCDELNAQGREEPLHDRIVLVLERWKHELHGKGVLPEYLAYAIEDALLKREAE